MEKLDPQRRELLEARIFSKVKNVNKQNFYIILIINDNLK